MKIDTNLLKSIAKVAAKALATIVFLTGSGILINWILLLFLGPELKYLFDSTGPMGGHGGGIAAILTLVLILFVNWKASFLFLAFFLGFPFLHFLFAKKYSISSAIFSLLKERKDQLVEFIFQKFFERVHAKTEWLEKLNSAGVIQTVNEYLPIFIKKLEGMPFPIRMILKFLFSRLDFLGIVSAVLNEQGEIDISPEELVRKISNKVNDTLDEKVFAPSFTSNLILYGANTGCFVLVKILI